MNRQKDKFFGKLPTTSIESEDSNLTIRCKFNFSYFSVQQESQDFCDWNHNELVSLLNKLKNYSEKSLTEWRNETAGKAGTVLSVYGKFPVRSAFTMPPHVPIEAEWGRFRLGNCVRFVGFILPTAHHNKTHSITGERFDSNTFYVVFLDKDHKFYSIEKK